MGGNLAEQIEHVAEDAVGSQFVAATEVAESLGNMVDAQGSLFAVWERQLHLARVDFEETLEEISRERTAPALVSALAGHQLRRWEHQMNGVFEVSMVWATEQKRLMELHQAIWRPFMRVVEEDI